MWLDVGLFFRPVLRVKHARPTRRKCRHCRKFFVPDYRNGHHQHYCPHPACRRASKAASQRRWLRQKANRNYFRGPEQVARVRQWRQAHPGYWQRQKPRSPRGHVAVPQHLNLGQSSCNAPPSPLGTLQDFCPALPPAFIGLLSMLTGSTLQEDIAATARQLLIRGQHVLGHRPPEPTLKKV